VIVYLIQCTLNNRFYVGKTTRTLQERWLEHIRDARSGRRPGDLYEDLRRFGAEAFTITELGIAYCQRRLNQMERKYIRLHGATINGYNKDVAAHGGKPKMRPAFKRVLTPLHKLRISERISQLHAQRKAQAAQA
jgi:group I intron endonuclease